MSTKESDMDSDKGPAPDRAVTPAEGAAPARRVVASFADYPQAERAVDHLADQQFPVQRTAIVAHGLRLVEEVTGRLTVWSAAGREAVTGALLGGLVGWAFAWFGWINLLIQAWLLILYGLLLGAVVGGIVGALLHLATGGKRDFSAEPRFEAESYDVLADVDVSDDAARLIRHLTTTNDVPARPA